MSERWTVSAGMTTSGQVQRMVSGLGRLCGARRTRKAVWLVVCGGAGDGQRRPVAVI